MSLEMAFVRLLQSSFAVCMQLLLLVPLLQRQSFMTSHDEEEEELNCTRSVA
jgi:hypothetical protein